MSRLPIPHIINTIKTKLGFDRAMTAPGADVVDAVNKQSTTDSALESGLAIVANGDTHATIAKDQFVYVKNHSTLAEGLYRAPAAIPTNGTLSASNLTADGSGGLNTLKSDIANKVDVKKHTGSIILSGESNKQYCYLDYTYFEHMWGSCYLMLGGKLFLVPLRAQSTSEIIKIVGPDSTSMPIMSIETENNRIVFDSESKWTHWGVVVCGQAADVTTITFA